MARALAIDYGRRRIGLAYSDPEQIIVSNRETIRITGMRDAIIKLTDYIKLNEIAEVVIGMPYREDGGVGELGNEIEYLRDELIKRLPDVKIEFADESYTSHIGTRILHESGMKIGDDKGRVDAAAAGVILDDYINRKRNGA
jgi:putative Holliday junction resolvase